jgi:hypothetical protein
VLSFDDIRGKHIAVCTPCYGGQVFQNYLLSVIKLVYACAAQGVHLSFIIRGGDSLIPRTRNSIVAEFMATENYTHLLWIDADIGFEPDAVFRLLRADKEVVAGVYPMKTIGWPANIPAMSKDTFQATYARYPFNPIGGRVTMDPDGFIEVLDAPTGLMMIKREAFDKLIAAYPDHRIIADSMPGLEHIADKIEKYNYRFFDVMTEANGRYLSEDYAFCRRWQAIGGRIFVDGASNLSHQGSYIYGGNFLESLKIKIAEAQAAQAAAKAQAEAQAKAQETEEAAATTAALLAVQNASGLDGDAQ